MKRYIRSDTADKLRVEYDGEVEYLPTWYLNMDDNDIEEAKQIVRDAMKTRRVDRVVEDDYYEDIDERSLRSDLRREGFSGTDIDEIVAMIYNGHTVDSAIQRQIMKNNGEW